MQASRPTFSIIIPCFNYAHSLGRALASVAGQSRLLTEPARDVLEVIAVDDGSTDDTAAVAERAFDIWFRPHGVRCVLSRQANAGAAVARNTGLDEARGVWIWFLDADDELVYEAMDRIQAAIDAAGDATVVFGGLRAFSTKNGRLTVRERPAGDVSGDIETDFVAYLDGQIGTLVPGSAVVRADEANDVRFVPKCLRSQDVVFLAQVLARGRAFAATGVENIILLSHRHDDSLRRNTDRMRQAEPYIVPGLFDADKLPPHLLKHRPRFAGRYGLDVSRNYYQNGEWHDATRSYLAAVRQHPRSLGNTRALRRFVAAWVRGRFYGGA